MTHPALGKKSLHEFTRAEFLQFVGDIVNVVDPPNNDLWVEHFIAVVPHPAGSDLIYWPEPGADDSPAGIVAEIERDCGERGLPCFADKAG